MTGGEVLSDGPHQQAEDRTGWTSHLPLERGRSQQRKHIQHLTHSNQIICNVRVVHLRQHKATQTERIQEEMNCRGETAYLWAILVEGETYCREMLLMPQHQQVTVTVPLKTQQEDRFYFRLSPISHCLTNNGERYVYSIRTPNNLWLTCWINYYLTFFF